MTLTVYPYKLSPGELEVRLEGGLPPLPGQVLRLESSGTSPDIDMESAYGQVLSVTAAPNPSHEAGNGSIIRLRVLHGSPTLSPGSAQVLEAEEIARIAQELQAPIEHPLMLGSAGTMDYFRLGALTIIQGPDFLRKHEALMLFVRAIAPYQRVLLLDPLGLSMPGDDVASLQAGKDRRLSLQRVGSKRFLDVFAELLPSTLCEAGLRTVANLLPPHTKPFLGFQTLLLTLEALSDVPLRNLILQNLHALAQAQIFADTPEEVFDLQNGLPRPVNILDLSPLPEPWKSLFYTEVCREALENAGGDVVLALIHPENHLRNLPALVRQADESELSLLALASPYPEARPHGRQNSSRKADSEKDEPNKPWKTLANNRIWVDRHGRATLQGELTLDLPVAFAVSSSPDIILSPVTSEAVQLPLLSTPERPARTEAAESMPDHLVATPDTFPSEEPEARQEAQSAQEAEPVAPSEETILSADDTEAFAPETLPAPPSDAALTADIHIAATELIAAESVDDEPFFFDSELLDELEALSAGIARNGSYEAELPTLPEDIALEALLEMSPSENTESGVFEPEPELNLSAGQDTLSSIPAVESILQTMPSLPPESSQMEIPAETIRTGLETSPEGLPEESIEPQNALLPSIESVAPPPFVEETPPIHHREPDNTNVAPTYSAYRVGERVRHPDYGTGVIRKILPMDDQTILNITFDQVGKRLLDPSLCTLISEANEEHPL